MRVLHLHLPPPSKPPITQVYTCRPKGPIDPSSTPTTLASPDDPVADVSNVANESQALSDELQVGPRYNLRDRTTIGPADKYGFPCVNAVVDEPSMYQEAANIPEWQLAMCEELAALDRQGLGILFHCHHMQCQSHLSGCSRLRENLMDL
jgi:hypothetical protein